MPRTLGTIAALAALTLALAVPAHAADVYEPAEYSRDGGDNGCARPVDPIGVYFYGHAASIKRLAGYRYYTGRGGVIINTREGAIYRATRRYLRNSSYTPSPWKLINDPRQSFIDTSNGYACTMPPPFSQVASEGMDRFHVRMFQKANRDGNGFLITVGTPHWDEFEDWCGHYVPERMGMADLQYQGYDGSGFDFARRTLADAMRPSDLHDVVNVTWRNTTRMQQRCGNSTTGGNGQVVKISYGAR